MKKYFLILLLSLCALSVSAQNWDINTLHTINSWDGKFVRNYSKAVSTSAPYLSVGVPAVIAICGGFKKDKKLLQDALYIGTSLAEAFVVTYVMKELIDRERPYVRYPDRVHPYSKEHSPSFPSGHTSAAFSVATSLSITYPKWYVITPCALWACSVGFSRMNEGVHYPSDVIAGAVVGAGCAVVNIYVNRWLNRLIFGEKKRAATSVAWTL